MDSKYYLLGEFKSSPILSTVTGYDLTSMINDYLVETGKSTSSILLFLFNGTEISSVGVTDDIRNIVNTMNTIVDTNQRLRTFGILTKKIKDLKDSPYSNHIKSLIPSITKDLVLEVLSFDGFFRMLTLALPSMVLQRDTFL